MAHQSNDIRFLLVTYPVQGHINPALQLAKRLIHTGAQVTLTTCMPAYHRISENSTLFPDGLTFAPFYDNNDGGSISGDDADHYLLKMRRVGGEATCALIEKAADEGQPFSCVIYTLIFPWAIEVTRKFHLFSALLWIQASTVFNIYYYYCNGYHDLIVDNIDDSEFDLNFPGLPLLKCQDLPSFFLPSNIHSFALKYFQELFDVLSQEIKSFRVIVNTFDELELKSLQVVEKFSLVGVGPLIPSAFLDGKDPMDNSFGGDLLDHSNEYLKWLELKDISSVVYVSFGSIAVLSNKQMEELARGLVDSGRPFLWVIREGKKGPEHDEDENYRKILSKEHKGMIVPWCSQVEVLSHGSIGCFVTHCGWNSTLEALAMGVPVIAFPQWMDQRTNAKLIVDVWKMGVRARPNQEDKIVHSEEFIRCLEQVMETEELRKTASRWKHLATEAAKEGGSSEKNLKKFVDEIRQFYW